jgi:trigger factor
MDPNSFAKAMDEAGQVPAMVAEVARRKGLAVVLAKTTVTDASGNVIDLEALFGPADAEELEDAEDIEDAELEDVEPAAAAAAPPVVPSAADPSAIRLSDVGGFVPDEPATKA